LVCPGTAQKQPSSTSPSQSSSNPLPPVPFRRLTPSPARKESVEPAHSLSVGGAQIRGWGGLPASIGPQPLSPAPHCGPTQPLSIGPPSVAPPSVAPPSVTWFAVQTPLVQLWLAPHVTHAEPATGLLPQAPWFSEAGATQVPFEQQPAQFIALQLFPPTQTPPVQVPVPQLVQAAPGADVAPHCDAVSAAVGTQLVPAQQPVQLPGPHPVTQPPPWHD
jgi:hypothetical protein